MPELINSLDSVQAVLRLDTNFVYEMVIITVVFIQLKLVTLMVHSKQSDFHKHTNQHALLGTKSIR